MGIQFEVQSLRKLNEDEEYLVKTLGAKGFIMEVLEEMPLLRPTEVLEKALIESKVYTYSDTGDMVMCVPATTLAETLTSFNRINRGEIQVYEKDPYEYSMHRLYKHLLSHVGDWSAIITVDGTPLLVKIEKDNFLNLTVIQALTASNDIVVETPSVPTRLDFVSTIKGGEYEVFVPNASLIGFKTILIHPDLSWDD